MARQDYHHSPDTADCRRDIPDSRQLRSRTAANAEWPDRFVVCTTFRHGEESPFSLVDDFDAGSLVAAIDAWQRDGYSVDIEYLYDV